jgi:hypothetical protein
LKWEKIKEKTALPSHKVTKTNKQTKKTLKILATLEPPGILITHNE